MKVVLIPALLFSVMTFGQVNSVEINSGIHKSKSIFNAQPTSVASPDIKYPGIEPWRIDKNKLWTGALILIAGTAKGFNEALQYKYNGFEEFFPKADDQWFYPTFSFNNKYKNHDRAQGAKFPLSTSVLVMFTDQYHLNNFIQKTALTAALVIKIGDKKRPFKHYLLDILYYTACYQAGFHAIYEPISMRNE